MARPVHPKGGRAWETSRPSYANWSRPRAPVRADPRRQGTSHRTSKPCHGTVSRDSALLRLVRESERRTRRRPGGPYGAQERSVLGDGGGRRLGGGQRRAHGLPRGATRHVPTRLAAHVYRGCGLRRAGGGGGLAVDPVPAVGGVVAGCVDGGVSGLRPPLPLPRTRAGQRLHAAPRALESRLRGHRGAACVAAGGRRPGRSRGRARNTPNDEQVRRKECHGRVLGRAMSEEGVLPESPAGEGGSMEEHEARPDSSLATALLLVMESLTPAGWTVLLLQKASGCDRPEVPSLVGESEADCFRIARCAKMSTVDRRYRFENASGWKEDPW